MALCACFNPGEHATTEHRNGHGEAFGEGYKSKKEEIELKVTSGRRSSGKMRKASGELPTLVENPEEEKSAQTNCSFPSGLLVNASTMGKNFTEKQYKEDLRPKQDREDLRPKKRLSDISIMASYDSVIMESDAASIHSSRAPSSKMDREEQEAEDYDNFGTPQWTIDPHDIFFVARNDSTSKVCRIGRGEHGPVYLGVWKERDVAVKLSKQRPTGYRAERQFHAKVAQLYGISHPNIVKFFGACFWKGGKRCVALTEYMEKGSLSILLDKQSSAKAQIQNPLKIALDIAKGLAHLHEIGVAHGRVKASNILFSNTGQAKVAVPCLSTLLNHVKSHTSKSKSHTFEPMTIAPEIAKGASTSTAADMYCFGVIMWRLLTKEQAHQEKLRALRSPEEASPKIAWLIESCLDPDPESRPSARMLVSILNKSVKS